MIYLNNAATSFPKPQQVQDTLLTSLSQPPAGQYRSGSALRTDVKGDIFTRCKQHLACIFGLPRQEAERIYFASGATDASNRVINGLFPDLNREYRIITTATEHNSILRPLYNIPRFRKYLTVLPCDESGFVDPSLLKKALQDPADGVIVNHCSNVTGTIQDLSSFAELTHRRQIPLVVDCAQSAGCLPIDAKIIGIDALIFTGHKSLFGIQGTGGYYIRSGLPFVPTVFGGTGKDSSRLIYTDEDSFEFEPGTQNGPGISALTAGCDWILSQGLSQISLEDQRKVDLLMEELQQLPGVHIIGNNKKSHGPLFSLTMDNINPNDVAYILSSGYNITVRTGLHCAPIIHQYLKTDPLGTVRVSISALTPDTDLKCFLEAMRELSSSLV